MNNCPFITCNLAKILWMTTSIPTFISAEALWTIVHTSPATRPRRYERPYSYHLRLGRDGTSDNIHTLPSTRPRRYERLSIHHLHLGRDDLSDYTHTTPSTRPRRYERPYSYHLQLGRDGTSGYIHAHLQLGRYAMNDCPYITCILAETVWATNPYHTASQPRRSERLHP